jgi:Golgi-body localisation protein domain/RNA pol II promoter Fmp27 protein domain
VAAPYDREWSFSNLKASNSYNTVHLSPRFFTHFFDWWSLFSGVMSLPIRQGHLWRGPEKTSKKFGRHLATIKYNLLLSPLFIAHIYKHKDADDYAEDIVSATGLKLRLDSFMLDLHQRREWFDTVAKGKSKQTRTSAMRINEGQLDFINADMRAVSANIGGTNADDLLSASDDVLSTYQQPVSNVDMSRFTIPDQDMSWIDMDDFVELDWVLPSESNPETKILPLAFTPRFTYFRQTDHEGAIHGDETRSSPFGNEPTHYCVMSHDNDPRRVQMELVKERIESITKQIQSHTRLMGEQELRVVRDGHQDAGLRRHHDLLVQQNRELHAKHDFLLAGLARLADQRSSANGSAAPLTPEEVGLKATPTTYSTAEAKAHDALDYLFPSAQEEFASDFNNRFMIHNIQFKWNNSLRNIILRYGHQVSQRRGFIYYMSRRAVKFIIDIVDEQNRSKVQPSPGSEPVSQSPSSCAESPTDDKDQEDVVRDRIDQLLKDAKRFVDAEDPAAHPNRRGSRASAANSERQLSEDFVPQNSYHVRLIAPQIQLQSEKNTKASTIVSAKGMQLKVVSIMDKARLSDDVSGLVQRQFSLDMDGAQFFVTTQKRLYKLLHLYSGNTYGNSPGSSWPPWVSLEVMFDFELNPFGFERVIQKTSATLRYEKYNTLRLKYNEEVASAEDVPKGKSDRGESRIDHLSVDFPRIRARCDSAQYYALYIIVLDLLLYSEPREKVRSERLEKIMLASDFSDLRGAPEIATSLQERIRQLEDIKNHFQVNAKYLDRQGWQDRISLEKDLAGCEDELFFIMKAITTSQSQRKNEDRQATQPKGLLRWYLTASEIVWHLMRDKNEPLLEFQLGHAAYERIDNSDGSNHNAMEIEKIHGLNLLPSALYPEMIGPYHDLNPKGSLSSEDQKMIKVHWYMLEAIAGIPVLEQFQVTLFPLKVQLERDLGKKLFEYIFPGVQSNAFENKNFSPFMIKNMQPLDDGADSEDEEASNALIPDIAPEDTLTDTSNNMSETASINRRMKPTLALSHDESLHYASHKPKGLGISTEHHHLNLFKHTNSSSMSRLGSNGTPRRQGSLDSLSMSRKQSGERSSTNISGMTLDESRRKFGLPRSSSKDRREKGKKDKPSDELSQMMSRANNFMTLAHVRLDSVVICLSYKGKGDRNLEDLHDFVFRMPVLEYRNKTWSNLDLALRLKKDFIRALISHAGAIIGNKFHHRPNRQLQSRLRETASSSQILSSYDSIASTPGTSDAGSLINSTPTRERSLSPRRSFTSSKRQSSPLMRTDSFPSSIHSSRASSIMTPMNPPSDMIGAQTFNGGPTLIPNVLSRHFSDLHLNRGRQPREESVEESDQENTKKKAVLLLGRKILDSLS